jgi:hypothetical protein
MKKRIGYLEQPDKFADITVPPAMLAEFKVMVQRATSTWQDMSPDMRDFADRVLGRAAVMGSNMKEGFQEATTWDIPPVSPVVLDAIALAKAELKKDIDYAEELRTKAIATRSCCGTMLREPHLASCPELSKIILFLVYVVG